MIRGADSRGSSLVAVLLLSVVLSFIVAALIPVFRATTHRSGMRRTSVSALNFAESGKEHLFGVIRSGVFQPLSKNTVLAFKAEPLGSGSFAGTYTVSCSSNAAVDSIWVCSEGTYSGTTRVLDVVATIRPELAVPFPGVNAAITARNGVDIKGNITIDGRDFDSLSAGPVGPGVYGVSTWDSVYSFDQASSQVGGNGLAPVSGKRDLEVTTRTRIMREKAPFDSSLLSPERVLGVADSSLDRFKGTVPSGPFHSVVYVESDFALSSGNSSGILIVHNSTFTATLRLNGISTFKGLIIADRIDKINGNVDVLGAIVAITPSGIAVEGNGSARVRYSSEILRNLHRFSDNMGIILTEVEWRERGRSTL